MLSPVLPQSTSLAWPPTYTVRHSARVRRVQLRITQQRGLEIIAPVNFAAHGVLDLLQQHRAWIVKTWERMQPQLVQTVTLPTKIRLAALEQTWSIHYEATTSEQVFLRVSATDALILHGNVNNLRKCQRVLCNWLRQRAAATLLPWLAELSATTQLTYRHGKIGNATTRWGSCSQQRDIMLNWHLLFLTKALARHVIIHELCHTRYMDHSARFWRLVAQCDSQCSQLRRELKTANQVLPAWLGSV